HRPDESRIDFCADLALNWAQLRRKPRAARKLACVVSDYPAKAGRAGYAVGLDTPASLKEIAALLAEEGYSVETIADKDSLIRDLAELSPRESWPLAAYREAFGALPESLRIAINKAWGDPEKDSLCDGTQFRFRA